VAVHAAAADPGGIAVERDAITERAAFAYQDWMSALAALADIEDRMVAPCPASWAWPTWSLPSPA
jgi:hypothetical protein